MQNSPKGSDESVFEGSFKALLKRFAGGVICILSLTFLLAGIFLKGVRWDLNWAIAILLLFSSLFLLFLLEGTQIAVVRLKEGDHIPPTVFNQAPEVAQLLTEMGEYGVANYLIGRQVLVCANVYLVAALTELGTPLVSRVLTILAGIFTVVCFGQLIPQLMADINPILFCRIPLVRRVIQLSAFLSKLGVGHFSYWIGVLLLGTLGDDTVPGPGEEVEDNHDVKLIMDAGDGSKFKMEKLSREIFDSLHVPLDLDVTSQDHISPHILLAISHGLLSADTSPKAEMLLNEVLSEVQDAKKKEILNSFLRQKQVRCVGAAMSV